MKLILSFLAAATLATTAAALETADLSAVAAKFDGASPEDQYAARVELKSLIDRASCPKKGDRAATTTTILAVLDDAQTPVEAKKYLLRSLGRVGTPDAIPALSKLFQGSDALLKEEARLALECIPGPKATAVLEGALAPATDKREKLSLANSLAIRKAASAIPLLSALVVDPDPEIAKAGITALAKIGASEALQKAYASSKVSADLKPDIEKALLFAGADAAVARKIYDTTACPAAKLAAFKIVAAGDGREAIIADALESDNTLLRQAAIQCGLKNDLADVQKRVAASMDSFAVEDRLAVLSCIQCVKPAATAEKIALACASSEDEAEKAAALVALGKIGTAPAFQVALQNLSAREKAVSKAAAGALATMAYAQAEVELLAMLKGNSGEDKIAAIKALAFRHVDGAGVALLAVAKSNDQAAAKEALKTLNPIATTEDLAALVAAAKETTDAGKKKLLTSVSTRIAERIGTDEAKKLADQLQ